MRHLVLGSEGQIGKYVCDELERNGDKVVRWDAVLGGEYLLDLEENFEGLSNAVSSVDFVHFLAYNVGGSTYLQKHQDSYYYIAGNIEIMRNTFNVLRRHETPFYFASSQMSNMSDSVYGQLKAVGESYTRALGGINIQFWNVYGYESDPEKTHVITDFIKMALSDGRILCRTDGSEHRHFSHAADIAVMLRKLSYAYPSIKEEMPGIALPFVSNLRPWVTIWQVAALIAELIPGTEIYFGTKKDRTQTKKNEIDYGNWEEMTAILDGYPGDPDFKSTTLVDGLRDMINRIKEEG